MKERIKEMIRSIISENEQKKNGRDYALLIELNAKLREDVRNILNELYKSNEIIVGDTLNDKWIKINNEKLKIDRQDGKRTFV